ncbi:hypothetical protein [Chamaesiphon sp. VAR_69_metabat_338]|nr:hypothetical protein [Chamaesiphon sp. VAR_69_metabat_338]
MLSKNQSSQLNSPDFSAVDSLAKAEDLFSLGQLENLLGHLNLVG